MDDAVRAIDGLTWRPAQAVTPATHVACWPLHAPAARRAHTQVSALPYAHTREGQV